MQLRSATYHYILFIYISKAADGFLFVVECDSGKIIYVSDSVTHVLNHSHNEFDKSCLYQWVHPEDVDKVQEQLSTQDTSNSSRILDMKSGTVKKESHQSAMRLCMSSRRGFICRLKVGNVQPDAFSPTHLHRLRQRNSLGPSQDGNSYAVVHCTGYIKNWNDRIDIDDASSGHYCLVAIGRLQVISAPNASDLNSANSQTQFMSRHNMDGKFTFVDQRVTSVLGYQPQELLGKTCFEYFHPDDQARMKESFDQILKLRGQVMSILYRFRTKDSEWVFLRTQSFAFLNPYTDKVEYIVCTNTLTKGSQNPASLPSEHQQSMTQQPVNTIPTDSSFMLHQQHPLNNSSIIDHTQQLSNTVTTPKHDYSDVYQMQQQSQLSTSTNQQEARFSSTGYNYQTGTSNDAQLISYGSSTVPLSSMTLKSNQSASNSPSQQTAAWSNRQTGATNYGATSYNQMSPTYTQLNSGPGVRNLWTWQSGISSGQEAINAPASVDQVQTHIHQPDYNEAMQQQQQQQEHPQYANIQPMDYYNQRVE